MRRTRSAARVLAAILAASLMPLPAPAREPAKNENGPPTGSLLAPQAARLVVREEECRCSSDSPLRLVTLGAESERDAAPHFQPLLALAFDPSLREGRGQWMALWSFGLSPAGERTLAAFLPAPLGAARSRPGELERLEKLLEKMRQGDGPPRFAAPEPHLDLARLGSASTNRPALDLLRRGLDWASVINPLQLLYRSYLLRLEDRRERRFQRAYVGLGWLLDLEFDSDEDAALAADLNELRFHLLRERSFFGRWVRHGDAVEFVSHYESDVRRQLGKTSSWLQSAANEHGLRYQPLYRYAENGAAIPFGGILSYDPRVAPRPELAQWEQANPFDLPYNPFTHPRVQALARAQPGELIPLAVYIFQTHLELRPIIAIDFFAPANPQARETSTELIQVAEQWLALTTGLLSPARLPYALIVWAANKKGFTPLVNKSSPLGVEELRLALEAGLYFDPALRAQLLERADRRVLNPLVRPGEVETVVAGLQYQRLRAAGGEAVCRAVAAVREELRQKLGVPRGLAPAETRAQLAARLEAWRHHLRLKDYLEQRPGDLLSPARLEEPLLYFQRSEAPADQKVKNSLRDLYGEIYLRRLELPASAAAPELDRALELSRAAWERVARGRGSTPEEFARRRERREQASRAEHEKELKERRQERHGALRKLLAESRRELERAAEAGCRHDDVSPAALETHLALLLELGRAPRGDPELERAWTRALPGLHRQLERLERSLAGCAPAALDSWQAGYRTSCLELARALQQELSAPAATPAGGSE